ncbi:MAG: signal peptidase I [Odoribacter sp.]|nr:signal peptidase I [Odoribacter sp.]
MVSILKRNALHPKCKKTLKFIFHCFLHLLIAIAIAVFLRLFVIGSFKIPTPSMEPTILPGDYILVNKLIPGPRFFKNYDFLSTGERPKIKRLKGIKGIQRNDIVVFNFPYSNPYCLQLDLNGYYVKRCIGLPGDTLSIECGFYRIKGVTGTLGFVEEQKDIARLKPSDFPSDIYPCYPYDPEMNWNIQNFGPLYVPAKGDCMKLTPQNFKLYKNLMEYETGKTVYQRAENVFMGNILMTHYIFQTNYYFIAGDLIRDSRDSRYWGLLPKDHIVGKAIWIWKSEDMHTGKLRRDRFFKAIQ